jgi:2-polyprenyl-3-methyl-5-hydroxy-6-metoxy-1,4-benzoquinol methylase
LEISPIAGGIRIANSNRCTTSTHYAWTGSTSISAWPGKRILDVGCGGGLLSEGMALRGAEVTGIDLSEKPLSVAKLHLLETGQKWIIERFRWKHWPMKCRRPLTP